MKQRTSAFSLVLVALVLSLAILAPLLAGGMASWLLRMDRKDVLDWNSEWHVETEEQEDHHSLPIGFPWLSKENLTLQKQLPSDLTEGTYFYLKTSYLPVTATVDGVPVPVNGIFGELVEENAWTSIRLPQNAAGKTLELRFAGNGCKLRAEVYRALLGQKEPIDFQLLTSTLPTLVISALLWMFAIAIVICAVAQRKSITRRYMAGYVCLACYTLLADFWLLTDSDLQAVYFVGSRAFYWINVFSFLLTPLFFVFFIELTTRCYTRFLRVIEGAFVALAVTELCFLLFKVSALRFVITASHVLLALAACASIMAVIAYQRKRKTVLSRCMLAGVLLLCFMALVAVLYYYLGGSADHTIHYRYGVLLFTIFLSFGLFNKWMEISAKASGYEELRVREEEYRIAASHSEQCLLRYDLRTRRLEQSEESLQLLGGEKVIDNVPESLLLSGCIQQQSKEVFASFFAQMQAGVKSGEGTCNVCLQGKKSLWLRAEYTLIADQNGEPFHSVISVRDVTELHKREIAYEQWLQSYRDLPTDRMNYYEGNLTENSVERAEGGLLSPLPADMERTLSAMIDFLAQKRVFVEDKEEFLRFFNRKRLLDSFAHGIHTQRLEYRRLDDAGEPLWTVATAQILTDPYTNDVKCFILLQDNDKEKRNELQTLTRSNCDPLTGILNRGAFQEQLILLLTQQSYQRHALIMIDLDGFKRVNDLYGHQFGDRVLVDVANDMKAMLRADDLIGRVGGDEFFICLHSVPENMEILANRCHALCKTLGKQFGTEVGVTGSLGVAIYPKDGQTFDELYRHADEALYYAKKHGKSRFIFFSEEVQCEKALEQCQTRLQAQAGPSEMVTPRSDERLRTLLVVDDVEMNREILSAIFSDDYQIVQASNGKEALEKLLRSDARISAVLLDLFMPVMNGLELLEQMRGDSFLSAIPVIITSAASETEYGLRAISLGASDFVNKPIDAQLVRLRVKNVIHRHEAEDLRALNRYLLAQRSDETRHQNQLRYLAEHDSLTKICNKAAFERKSREMLEKNAETQYMLVAFDIDKFRVLNDIFGHEEGDKLLCSIASNLQTAFDGKGTYARINTDNFAFCCPYSPKWLQGFLANSAAEMKNYGLPFDIVLCFGVYVIDDRTLPVSAMYDRAVLAKRTVKGNYVKRIAYYDGALRQELLQEQEITGQMNEALEKGQFVLYLQPKCQINTGAVLGAEVLVRWVHPTKGMLSPSRFIPLFEKNGFIMQLDAYMWEQACKLLRRWIDQGVSRLPVPISTNISRVSIYNPNLCQTLIELVRRYQLPPGLLELEITESAYADNPTLLMNVIQDLRSNGFRVSMDDFGSGYSSLNMLKDIPVDLLKLDMRFLAGRDVMGRGGSILTSVVRMARWLCLPVVAEGVETAEQANYLRSIGCMVAQGYHYYRPMPVEDFEELMTSAKEQASSLYTADHFDVRIKDLWSTEGDFSVVLDCTVDNAAICEQNGDRLEVVRANRSYIESTGESGEQFFAARGNLNCTP